MKDRDKIPVIIGGWACLIVWAALLGGCSVTYDQYGNPQTNITNPFNAPPSERQKIASAISDTANTVAPWLPPPFGQILLGAGGLAAGIVGERRVRKAADSAWDERDAIARKDPITPETSA